MFHAPGYDKVHSSKFPGVFCNLLFWYLNFPKQTPEQVSVLFIGEIIHKGSRDHTAHSGNFAQLLYRCIQDTLRIIYERPADHLRVGDTDIRDSQAVDETGKCRCPCVFDTVLQVLIRFISKAFHLPDLIRISVQMKQVRKVFYISIHNKFLQSRLGKSFDIHGVPAHKKCK